MPDWRTVRIADVAEIYDGPHATPHKTDDGPWFLSISSLVDGRLHLAESAHLSEDDFHRWTRRVTPKGGDVLFSYETRLGEAALMPDALCACLGRRMGLLRPRIGVNPRFLLYAYLAPGFQREIQRRAVHGATVDRIPINELGQWPIRMPDRRVQDAIVEVLGALDDKIEANGRLVPLLRDLAVALLQQAAERGTVYRVADVADVRKGLSYAGAGLADAGMPMVNLANAANFGWLKRSDFKHYTGAYKPRHVAPPGALLVSGVEQTWRHEILGWPMLLPDDIGPALFSQDVFIVDFRDDAWLRLPLWAHLYTSAARERLEAMTYGTTVARFPTEALTGLAFPAPPPGSPVLDAAEQLVRRGWAAERETAHLAALRDALLPPLLDGRLRVRDAVDRASEHV